MKALSLQPEKFFNGKIEGYGILQLRNLRVKRRFKIDMNGSWDEGNGLLNEEFYFDDGEIQKRIWSITKKTEHIYHATAEDVVGAAKGNYDGVDMRWLYTLSINVGKRNLTFKFDDQMFIMKDGTVINKSIMTKFKISVAELTIILKKLSD